MAALRMFSRTSSRAGTASHGGELSAGGPRGCAVLRGPRTGTGSAVSSGAPGGFGPAAARSWSCAGQPGAPGRCWGRLSPWNWHRGDISFTQLCGVALVLSFASPRPCWELRASSFRAWTRGVLWAPFAVAASGSLTAFWLLSDSSVCNKACGERVRSCFLWDRLRCSGHLCAVEPCHVRTAGPCF